MSTRSHLDTLTDLLGRTPKRFRSPTPEERTRRREAAAERARIAAQIEAELDAALARMAAERGATAREATAREASAGDATASEATARDAAAGDATASEAAAGEEGQDAEEHPPPF